MDDSWRDKMETTNTNIHGWWCPRCGYFESSSLDRREETAICPTCGCLVNGHDPEEEREDE